MKNLNANNSNTSNNSIKNNNTQEEKKMKKATANNGANSTNNMVNENKNFKEVKTMKANNNLSSNNINTINENKNLKEESTMIDINNINNPNPVTLKLRTTINGMTAEEIIKAIEEKRGTSLSKAAYTFIKLLIERRYTTKWLSLSFYDPMYRFIFDSIELFDFDHALSEWAMRGIQSGFEYDDAGEWWCMKIEEALAAKYNYVTDGDIAPFIDYCWARWEEGEYSDIVDYEDIRSFFKEMKGEDSMKADINGKAYLATTKNGYDIYIGAETWEHLRAHSDVSIKDTQEAIKKNETYNGSFEIKTITFSGLPIGKDHCIEVAENDPEVHPLYRKGRAGTTPVTFSKEAPYTSKITIGICLDDDGVHTLFTAFYGQLAPREPWDPSLPEQDRAESEEFWKNHAIVALPEEIDWERSDTKFMPKKQEEEEMENEDKKMQMSRVLDTITSDYAKYNPTELLSVYETIIQMETDIYGLCVIPSDDDDFRRLMSVKNLIEATLLKKLDETNNDNTQEEKEMNPINYIENMTVEELKYLIDYSMEGPDGNMVRHVDFFKTETALFNFASHLYAFDDCYDTEVHAIICDHISCKYTGWQRGMVFTYVNTENGEVVWECEYPEFNH